MNEKSAVILGQLENSLDRLLSKMTAVLEEEGLRGFEIIGFSLNPSSNRAKRERARGCCYIDGKFECSSRCG